MSFASIDENTFTFDFENISRNLKKDQKAKAGEELDDEEEDGEANPKKKKIKKKKPKK